MTDSRLCEDMFRSSSDKVSVHSSEVFDNGVVVLGFVAPQTFDACQVRPGEPQLSVTISRKEMDELCDYWLGLRRESKAPKSYRTKIVQDGDEQVLILPDELMMEAGYAIGDQFEVNLDGETFVFTKIDQGEGS